MNWDTNHREYEGGGTADICEEDDDQWRIEIWIGDDFDEGGFNFIQAVFAGDREEATARADAVYAVLKLAHGAIK